MKACGIIAASLFGALVAAAPVNKRDIVWITETAVEIVTLPITKTVWVGAGEATSVAASSASTTAPAVNVAAVFHPHQPKYSSSPAVSEASSTSSSVEAAATTSSASVYVEPTTSSTSSVYVEPTTSSTSVYVAPATTSSTSVYVAPTTSSTSVYVAPSTTEAPTSTYVAPSSTSSTAAAASTTSSSSGSTSGLAASGTSYTGDLTWYQTGLGACGWDNTASDHIVAISLDIFDAYYTADPNSNPLCGRYVSITGKDGSQYQAKVVDRCTGCAKGDLDLSEDFFNTVTDNGDGRVSGMSWSWV